MAVLTMSLLYLLASLGSESGNGSESAFKLWQMYKKWMAGLFCMVSNTLA